MTAAATVWVLAGIGLAVAEDMWLTAVLIAATVVALRELSPLSDATYRLGVRRHGDPDHTRRDQVCEEEAEQASRAESAPGDRG